MAIISTNSDGTQNSNATNTITPSEQPKSPTSNDDEKPIKCFLNALTRKKPLDGRTDTDLNRCLTLTDLTTLGVGSTLGLGLYVLAGQVASTKAGPGVVISFALAALASAFSALCYAEFAGRVPRAGSAYAYSYITVGEFVAFVIGWNLVLEYVIGASSVARGFSGYLVYVCQHIGQSLSESASELVTRSPAQGTNRTATFDLSGATKLANSSLPLVAHNFTSPTATATTATTVSAAIVNYLVKYFDWPSTVIVVLLTCFILFGVRESTNVTKLFTLVNLLVVVSVVLSSFQSIDWHNWQLSEAEVPAGSGRGGFLPYGWSGVLSGSALCFFGFIGFDTIASSAEEARNPKRNVPIAIILSLFISFVAYVAIAIVQTLLWPYYDQNKVTILPSIFARLDSPLTYWIVLLGATAGLASSQLGAMYPLPRILYSMAQDRLIYGYLANVNKRLRLPVRATIVGSIFVALLACLLDIEDLTEMVSIGTLAAYSLVSLSVLIIRYEDRRDAVDDSTVLSSRLSISDVLQVAGDNKQFTGILQNKPKLEDQQVTACCVIEQNNSADAKSDVSKPQTNLKRPKLLDLLIVWKKQNARHDPKTKKLIERPDEETDRQSKILIISIVLLTILLDLIVMCLIRVDLTSSGDRLGEVDRQRPGSSSSSFLIGTLLTPKLLLTSSGCISLIALLAANLMLSRLPVSAPPSEDMFQVPLVPLVPTLSILVNTFLMLNLSYLTWVRFTVWMSIGLFIYFTYGIWNSVGYLLHINK